MDEVIAFFYQRIFEKLRFSIDNFKPIAKIKPEHRDKMLWFLNQAYDCRLKAKKNERERRQEIDNNYKIYSGMRPNVLFIRGKYHSKWIFWSVSITSAAIIRSLIISQKPYIFPFRHVSIYAKSYSQSDSNNWHWWERRWKNFTTFFLDAFRNECNVKS